MNVRTITQTAQAIGKWNLNKKRITGSTLKIIAIISMIIDHIGSIILERVLIQRGVLDAVDAQAFSAFLDANAGFYNTYVACKIIGRIAFPIFCFLLVEGFLHTRDLKKYLSRIFLFAFVSEVPFDLAFFGVPFYWGYQNVFLTLFFGVLAIAGIRLAEGKKGWRVVWRVLFGILLAGLCIGAAGILKTDYNKSGLLTIVVMYLFRRKKTLSIALGCVPLKEITAFASLIPIYLYNGERGRTIKWFFYLFYPVHILLFYLISCALGFGQVNLIY